MKGQQKVCIPHITPNFNPIRMVATCFRMWTLLTRDPNVLHIISQGVRLDFTSIPPQERTTVFQPCLSATQTATINVEIESLLCLKVIVPSPLATCLWISPIFTTLNKDGTSRLILNLKRLNLLITHIPFKMESIRVDLHHAYYSVSVHEPHRPYLSFLWQGTYYHYLRLPNGYAQAPLIFTKLLRLPFGSLRSQGHLSVVYMDDSYLQGDSVSSCRRNINVTVSLLQALGFNIINERKSVLTPTQSLEFLGFIINSTDMTITLTPRWKRRSVPSYYCKPNRKLGLFLRSLAWLLQHYRRLDMGPSITVPWKRTKIPLYGEMEVILKTLWLSPLRLEGRCNGGLHISIIPTNFYMHPLLLLPFTWMLV